MTNNPTFVIPLGAGSTWDNNELRYMLRSLEKHCQFDFDVIIYCTKQVDWLTCKQVVVERTYPQEVLDHFAGSRHYENYYDVIHKLRAAIEDEEVPEEFFFMYDDILLLTDLYLNDLRTIYAGSEYKNNPKFYDDPKNKWMRTIHASLVASKRHERPMFLYETHLPRWFKKSNLTEMFNKFSPEANRIPYAISTLYYNMFYDKPDVCYFKDNTVKAGFYGGVHKSTSDMFLSRSNAEINDAVRDKIWANHSNAGLTGTFKLWMEKIYTKKSRYEI